MRRNSCAQGTVEKVQELWLEMESPPEVTVVKGAFTNAPIPHASILPCSVVCGWVAVPQKSPDLESETCSGTWGLGAAAFGQCFGFGGIQKAVFICGSINLVITGRGAQSQRAGKIQRLRKQEHGERKKQFSRRASNGTWAESRTEGGFPLGGEHCHPSRSGCREPEEDCECSGWAGGRFCRHAFDLEPKVLCLMKEGVWGENERSLG